MKLPKIDLVHDVDDIGHYWYWRLIAANGETLCMSEIYTSAAAARKGIRAARIAALAPLREVDRAAGLDPVVP